MPPFADPSDVQAIWRTLTGDEWSLAAAWIDEASQQVRDEVPDVDGFDVDERIVAGSLSADTVRSVVARMVRRVMVNPEGLRARTEQTGPFSVTRTTDSSNSSGEMYITARELARLTSRHISQRAYMISPGPGPVFT